MKTGYVYCAVQTTGDGQNNGNTKTLGIKLFVKIISSTNFNAQFNNNMYVTQLSSTCFGP